MKYFFKTLVLIPVVGSFICIFLFIFLAFVVSVNNNSYSLAHIDKMNMLNSKENKIVIFGGSNVAFGINSILVSEAFPQYKVINVGTQAGIGVRYPLKEIKEKLKENDILIISPEYEQFKGGYGGTPLLEICLYKKSFKNLEIKEILNIVKNIKEIFLSKLSSHTSSKLYGKKFTYDRRGFNEYGDYVEHHKFERESKIVPEYFIIEEVNDSVLKFFYKIQMELKEKKVNVLFFPPVYQRTSGKGSINYIKKVYNKMELNKTPILSKPEFYFLEDKYFYDSVNHLNKVGGEIRTRKLINDLKQHLKEE